ncbi:Protein of unknown function [Azotobacter beijerinckii]|uniref:DUF551 domain-containing protein n=1 Tax=Azotobacter beijerinckii TaxID=170623 RepID=A0A1H9JSI3_9GAMM|nr:DUF551 domain-containing protein [Azotobacter beijerinckii]SEQ89760.1 Protein of unknown function [Azotobacter beijerinckii]
MTHETTPPVQSLHDEIMRLPCTPPRDANVNQMLAYKSGHRDARHAAAELAAGHEADARRGDPVAMPDRWALVPKKLTPAMIEAALAAHYGARRLRQAGGPGGVDMTVNGVNYSGTQAMKRMWAGALSAAPTLPAGAWESPSTPPAPPALRNRHGIDAAYFDKKLTLLVRDFDSFTPDELARSLARLAKVADADVLNEAEFVTIHPQEGMEIEDDGWWNSDHDIYTWPIRIDEWGARIECHGLNPDDAKALAQRVIARSAPTPPMQQVEQLASHELLPDEIHQMAFEEGRPAENGDGYQFTAEEFDLFVDRLLARAASSAQQPVALRFPTTLRKMWSGGDVQAWLDQQGPLYAAPPAQQSQWVPVSERLPELDTPVLLIKFGDRGFIGERNSSTDGWSWAECDGIRFRQGEGWVTHRSFFDDLEPTHWMPLPAAPGDTAAPEQAEQPSGTTSDKYRAELYDEVWQKARDMGYGNVTEALVELERIKEQAEQQDVVMVPRGSLEKLRESIRNFYRVPDSLRDTPEGSDALHRAIESAQSLLGSDA